ncbi:MAG: hypothetical protein AAB902_01670 [Patescibacteria group bacterium]
MAESKPPEDTTIMESGPTEPLEIIKKWQQGNLDRTELLKTLLKKGIDARWYQVIGITRSLSELSSQRPYEFSESFSDGGWIGFQDPKTKEQTFIPTDERMFSSKWAKILAEEIGFDRLVFFRKISDKDWVKFTPESKPALETNESAISDTPEPAILPGIDIRLGKPDFLEKPPSAPEPEPEPEQNSQEPVKKIGYHTTPDGIEEHYNPDGKITFRKFPDGIAKYYRDDGTITSITFPNGDEEQYNRDETLWRKLSPDILFGGKIFEEYDNTGKLIEKYRFDGNGNKISIPFNTSTQLEPAPETVPPSPVPDAEAVEEWTEENQRELEELEELERRSKTETFSTDFIKENILMLLKSVKKITEIKSIDVREVGKEIILNIKVKSSGFNIEIQAILENKEGIVSLKSYNIDASWLAKREAEKALRPYLEKISETLKEYIEKETGKRIEKIEIIRGGLKATFK